ncbi:MAG: hypothetical protein HC892_23020 [Saprospiraceae bacterium]|nr:hypothetical protein [Saprospiraceae bacterium]
MMLYNDKGDDITARIRQGPLLITDIYVLQGKQNSPLGIECMEDLDMLIVSLYKFQILLEKSLTLNIFVRKYLTEQLEEIFNKHILFISGTAKERYKFILENNPTLLKKFPLQLIASMIGITPTQLSRIRNKK